MNCNNITCPLSRLESVAQRLEAVCTVLGIPSLAEIYPAPTSEGTPPQVASSALDELWGGATGPLQKLTLDTTEVSELDELAQHEKAQLDAYNKRVEAWNFREQAVAQHQQERQEALQLALNMRPEDLTQEQQSLLDSLHASMAGLNTMQQEGR